ncbi:MAG: (2Fe-2S)-binding protein, partial [Beijerinckiaceae bacterium]
MIVCSCNVLTDSDIRAALNRGACPRTPFAVYKCLGCSLNCGRCI